MGCITEQRERRKKEEERKRRMAMRGKGE